MKDELFNILTFAAIIVYVSILMMFGVYSIDLSLVMQFVAAAILTTILSYKILLETRQVALVSLHVSQGFSRKLTLQRVDPLLC